MTLQFGLITVSDRSARGEREDLSGPALFELARKQGWSVVRQSVLPDELSLLRDTLSTWADQGDLDVILTTGGTGFAPRDVTPEATLAVVERLTPGLTEAMRAKSLEKTPHAMLSRGVAGIRSQTVIINLPGSPKAAIENFQVIIPVLQHAIELLKGDANAEKGHQSATK